VCPACAGGGLPQGTGGVLGGGQLVYNDANGFRLNNPSELEILGTACDKIKNDNTELVVSFPCDAVQIIK